jgi:hypothetical protein
MSVERVNVRVGNMRRWDVAHGSARRADRLEDERAHHVELALQFLTLRCHCSDMHGHRRPFACRILPSLLR